MVAPFDARPVEDGAVGGVFIQNLAFQDAAIFERQMEDISLCRVGHRIELHDSRHAIQRLQAVTHATQVAVTTM